ncbi:unknown [Prevotella sp. CAG:487]|nr:unknown [Prevotella sp. CAG:487]
MGIKRVELLRFTPKELTVQPCDLSRQLLDARLQFFILLSLFFISGRQ